MTTYSQYYIFNNTNTPVNSSLSIGGSCKQFTDIGDPSGHWTTVTGQAGRTGKRWRYPAALSNGNYRVTQWYTDISLNYMDLSWNFYIAVDNSRNFFYGMPISNGDGTYRNPIIHIYDISYNGRSDTHPDGTPYVPKVYDSSGGQANAFQNITFLLSYENNNSGGFTYSPLMYDPVEVLPSAGGGGGDPSGNQGDDGGGGGGGGGQIDPSGGTDSSGNNVADNSENIFLIDR